ncbi:hypothetical protein A2U01_0110561, partial [Trifolium medium]|nr:hypothetical protein [Trifolium medium]
IGILMPLIGVVLPQHPAINTVMMALTPQPALNSMLCL